jgi:hypothetical protein
MPHIDGIVKTNKNKIVQKRPRKKEKGIERKKENRRSKRQKQATSTKW